MSILIFKIYTNWAELLIIKLFQFQLCLTWVMYNDNNTTLDKQLKYQLLNFAIDQEQNLTLTHICTEVCFNWWTTPNFSVYQLLIIFPGLKIILF